MSSHPILSDKDIKKQMIPKFRENHKKYYPVKKLEELGFHRGICSQCGTGFWSQDNSRKVCGESVCSGGYTFIGKPLTRKRNLGYQEAWNRYVEIFNQWGYKKLDRYSVVARWYDDLYFTAAGINAFQPYIVSGEQDPPHQAVLEPQTVLRYNDIDNVGITGTHYTAFIMVGQHVFNSKKLGELYWMPEGIEQIFTFLKDGLTIPEREIVFHEDVWAGGGNFGPSMEFFAGGIELGNQVYMQYDSATMQQLETRIIDMGAGLERWSWVTSDAYTSYETTFPEVMKYLYTATGFTPDRNIWQQFMPYAGTLNVDEVDNIRAAWSKVASNLGMTLDSLYKSILPNRALYAIADHTRNLLFAIHDGALPSNVGGGYNLRNILRRCYSLIDEFEFDIDFHKIFEVHAGEIGNWFTELKEFGSLFDILDLEKSRYKDTQTKNVQFIQRLVKEKQEISTQELLKLYDSRGITPEMVHQIDPTILIPEDFYMKAQELHEQRQQKERPKLLDAKVSPTKTLYYEDAYASQHSFEANVLATGDSWVVLDQTHFYPEGGGQIGDTGSLNNVKVVDTQKYNNQIFHYVEDTSSFTVGQNITGQVDWDRRYRLMKLHSGTHLVKWAATKVLGPHIWQAGAVKKPDYATLDITHYKNVTHDEMQQIELLVNKAITEHPVESIIRMVPRTEAEQKFGMEIYQGGAIPETNLRIVSWNDHEACGGTHLLNSKEIGFLKITKSERIQDGIVRLTYVSGQQALKLVQQSETIVRTLSQQWKVGTADVIKEAEKITSEWLENQKEVTQLREKVVLWGLEKVLQISKSEIWLQSSFEDIRLLSSVFGKFLQDQYQVLQDSPKTIIVTTKNGLLAASTDPGINVEHFLQQYCGIVKQSKGKSKKQQPDPSGAIPFYQGFKLKSETIVNIQPEFIL